MRRSARSLAILLGAGLAVLGACGDESGGRSPARGPGHLGFDVEPMGLLSREQKAALGVEGERGVVVAAVVENGPAHAAGLRRGDFLLRVASEEVPEDPAKVRSDAAHKRWRTTVRRMLEDHRAGDRVAIEARRGDERMRFEVGAIDEAALAAASGGSPAPAPNVAATPTSAPWSTAFEESPGGQVPSGFWAHMGRWRVFEDDHPAGSPNRVLRQDATVLPWAVALAVGAERAVADGTVEVRFRPRRGVADASGGIVFRAQDGRNYYLARANALEGNFRLYVVKEGQRTELAGVDVLAPSLSEWHVLAFRGEGDVLRATLDGRSSVEARDATWPSGWVGLWTKADSETDFDDLRVEPLSGAGRPK